MDVFDESQYFKYIRLACALEAELSFHQLLVFAFIESTATLVPLFLSGETTVFKKHVSLVSDLPLEEEKIFTEKRHNQTLFCWKD